MAVTRIDLGDGSGVIAFPEHTPAPAVIVVQEWWGVDDWIVSVVERLAAHGFVALAPDLYRGEVAQHDEIDRAGELMRGLPIAQAALDMGAAADFLIHHEACTGDRVGVLGFCMGGMLALEFAARRPEQVGVVVSFYGFPLDEPPPYDSIDAPIVLHIAEHDSYFTPARAEALADELEALGKSVRLHVHHDTGHAFMAEHDTMGTHDPHLAERLWIETFVDLRP